MIEDVFEDRPFFRLYTFYDTVFESNDYEKEFFLLNEEHGLFPEIDLKQKYYFDTKAMSHKKIFVLLFGTLWDPDTLNLLRTMRDLHNAYSREAANQGSVVREAQNWFKSSIHTGFTMEEIQSGEGMESEDWQRLESAMYGARLFSPENIFVVTNEIFQMLLNVPYETDVTFAFVAVSGDDADAQEILKDENVPFAFLDDKMGRKTNIYVSSKLPYLLIVDHEGEIAYEGPVLTYMRVKEIIDRLMVGVFHERYETAWAEYHRIRLERHEKKIKEQIKEKKQNKE